MADIPNAMKDYENGMTYKEIAAKYEVSVNTVSSWKKRYNWNRKVEKKKNKAANRKRGAPKGNRNHFIHGFYSKVLPTETLEIVKTIDMSALDILWNNIQFAYAAILRAQKIMYVKDKEDISVTKVGESKGKIESEKWEVQYAWEKQANFMKSQARAQAELRSMIKQYNELLNQYPELDKAERQLKLLKLKQDIDSMNNVGESNELAEAAKKVQDRINGHNKS